MATFFRDDTNPVRFHLLFWQWSCPYTKDGRRFDFLEGVRHCRCEICPEPLQACETRLGQALQVESEKAAQGEAKRQATEEHLNSLQNASQNIRGKLERCKKAMELVHRHTFIPDTASREDTENFRSGLFGASGGFR